MAHYYNEFDPKAAAWLRELIKQGEIPDGWVDERSITDVNAHELYGYIQHHFFAGIAGWPLACRIAGVPEDEPVCTGSPPCQPFSAAGLQMGSTDPRHLFPAFRRLIARLNPPVVFGEQVASKLGREWLARVRLEMATLGYATRASDLCSAGVGSPNIRQRLFWVADADGRGERRRIADQSGEGAGANEGAEQSGRRGVSGRLADADRGQRGGLADGQGCQQHGAATGREQGDGEPECGGATSWLGHPHRAGPLPGRQATARDGHRGSAESDGGALGLGDANNPRSQGRYERGHGADQWTPWTASMVLPCTDGKTRRIEPGSFPLVAGLPGKLGRISDPSTPFDPQACAEGRVMRLKGYGNAINPWLAARFIQAHRETLVRGGLKPAMLDVD